MRVDVVDECAVLRGERGRLVEAQEKAIGGCSKLFGLVRDACASGDKDQSISVGVASKRF